MGYIYMITNTANGKSYIGQTVNDPITRIKLHLAGGPGSHFIVDDVKEFGIEKFAYQILHRNVSSELLNSLELQEIEKYKTIAPDGYNQIDGGGGRSPSAKNNMKRNQTKSMTSNRSDNSSFFTKARVRKQLLEKLEETPVILETHGGTGEIYKKCYSHIKEGIVFEKEREKAEQLVFQRPNWCVYENDCIWALREGVGNHLKINFIDCDPYGEAFSVLKPFFGSDRPRADRVLLVVHDGMRNRLQVYGAADMPVYQSVVEHFGDQYIYRNYLEVCEILTQEIVEIAGYKLESFGGFYQRHDGSKDQTHFFAELTQKKNPTNL